jgi:hypothetical protein
MPNGPMAVTCVTYSPDFAQWKWDVLPGRMTTLPGGIRLHFIAIKLIAEADVENARYDCVHSVLRVFVWHQFHI